MILSHKIKLCPTAKQAVALKKAAGCARFAWNWGLEEGEKIYNATGKTADFNEIKKRWNKIKPDWVRESPKDANQRPFLDLKKAYGRYLSGQAMRPRFKRKGRSKDSFYVGNDRFRLDGKRVRVSVIGDIKMTEELRLEGKIVSGTISRAADRWYISVAVETHRDPICGSEIIGIDFGLKHFATLSTGEVIDAPMPLKRKINTLRRRGRQLSRKRYGSKNYEKSSVRVARLYSKISNIRNDFLHKTTSKLVARAKLLVIEDLSMSGMLKRWGRKVSDLGIYETRRQLTYKCELNGCGLVIADRWYPSTQICMCCGSRHKIGLDEREYACQVCGNIADRDYNASCNLRTVGLMGINACGHEGSGYNHAIVVKPSWTKQELNGCQSIGTN